MQQYLHKGLKIFKILPLSDKALSTKVEEYYNFTEKEEEHIETLVDTLRCSKEITGNLSVALAAPQVGWNKRVFISADLSKATKKNVLKRIEVFINPTIVQMSQNKEKSEELCLSLPNKTAYVYRSDMVRIEYYNLMGKQLQMSVSGLQAFVYQHEMDHLDGISVLQTATSIVDRVDI